MTEPLYVHTDGVRSLSGIHDEVVAALGQVMGSAAPEALGVETTHGPIASAVSSALGQVLPNRQGTLQATSTSGQTISALLRKAAQMYEQGDTKGADTLREAAEAMQADAASGAGGAGSVGAGASGAGGGAAGAGGARGAGGTEMMGQMVSQVGQQVGQMAQSIAQPLQGLAQGLQQLPQTVMQGVQGIVQSATQVAGSAGSTIDAPKPDGAERRGDGEPRAEEREDEHRSDERQAAQRAEAQPGKSGERGRAPEPPPRMERPEPAQTRPQQSPL